MYSVLQYDFVKGFMVCVKTCLPGNNRVLLLGVQAEERGKEAESRI